MGDLLVHVELLTASLKVRLTDMLQPLMAIENTDCVIELTAPNALAMAASTDELLKSLYRRSNCTQATSHDTRSKHRRTGDQETAEDVRTFYEKSRAEVRAFFDSSALENESAIN